jgi:hypothetical protein
MARRRELICDRFEIGNHRVSVSASIAIDLSQPR